ncbi:MAG: PqqD family protein [bacterium]
MIDNKKYSIKKEIAFRKMKDETVTIVSPLTDKIITVNPVAGMIWEKLDGTNTVSEVAKYIQGVFSENDLSYEDVLADTVEIIEDFLSRELIEEKIDIEE